MPAVDVVLLLSCTYSILELWNESVFVPRIFVWVGGWARASLLANGLDVCRCDEKRDLSKGMKILI